MHRMFLPFNFFLASHSLSAVAASFEKNCRYIDSELSSMEMCACPKDGWRDYLSELCNENKL
jgi:hypothetical protein